jgi:hypothetical protein
VAASADRNIVQKEAENKIEIKTLLIELQRMRNMKCRITPVTYRATRKLTEILRKNLEATAGKHSIDSINRQLYLEHHK